MQAARMPIGNELKLVHERAGLETEIDDALNSFAAESDLNAPPTASHATHAPLLRDIPFTLHPSHVPIAPVRPARRRARLALSGLALLATAASAAFVYESRRPLEFDISAVPPLRAASPGPAPTAPAIVPDESVPADPPLTSDESAVAPEPARNAEIERPAPSQSVSGEWRLTAQAEKSNSFLENLKLHYDMALKQDGDRVTGVGTRVSANENGAGPESTTPVAVTGTMAGDRLTLNVVERGTQLDRGKFVLLVEDAGTLRGRFSSNTAPSSGHVEAHRVSSAQ